MNPPTTSSELDGMKASAARAAVAMVEPGMIVGLGTGSTSAFAVAELGRRVAGGLRIVGIPTSEETARAAERLGIPLSTLAERDRIDLTIDGADEIDVATLNLLKGRGGAALREKIVASASDRMVVIADRTKLVHRLGVNGPVAVEVVPFGWRATATRLRGFVPDLTRRATPAGEPFVTDGGNYILDCAFGAIDDPVALQTRLDATVGVVEHGLFLGLASLVIVGDPDGVRVIKAGGSPETP